MSGYTIAGFSLPYIASKEDAQQHVADWMRTRIEPGADPRVERVGGLVFWPHETGPRDRPYGVLVLAPFSRGSDYRYVPEDVRRWRDPRHRAALTQRARAHAAIVPGARAGMVAE